MSSGRQVAGGRVMNVWQSADQKTGHYFDLGLGLGLTDHWYKRASISKLYACTQ